MPGTPTARDEVWLRDAIQLSFDSVSHGNHPFGAVLVDESGAVVLRAENTVNTGDDVTGHAETNLVRDGWRTLGPECMKHLALYTSCEPCAMCSGAIYWSGISTVVFAMTEADLASLTGDHDENPTMSLSSELVLNTGTRPIEVRGPALAAEARTAHEGFWTD